MPLRTAATSGGLYAVEGEYADQERSQDARFDRRLARSDLQHPLPRAIRRPRSRHRPLFVLLRTQRLVDDEVGDPATEGLPGLLVGREVHAGEYAT